MMSSQSRQKQQKLRLKVATSINSVQSERGKLLRLPNETTNPKPANVFVKL